MEKATVTSQRVICLSVTALTISSLSFTFCSLTLKYYFCLFFSMCFFKGHYLFVCLFVFSQFRTNFLDCISHVAFPILCILFFQHSSKTYIRAFNFYPHVSKLHFIFTLCAAFWLIFLYSYTSLHIYYFSLFVNLFFYFFINCNLARWNLGKPTQELSLMSEKR